VQRSQDQLADAQRRASEAEAAFAARTGELAVAANELDAIAATYAANIRALQEAQAANAAQMQALTADAGREITKAAAALEQAQAALVRANGERDVMTAKRDTLRNEHGVKTGALEALREQVARLDRESAALLVAKHERELAAYPADGTPLTDLATATRDVQTAQREYERAKEELDRKEGALSQVGGNALRDEVSRLEEARAAAQLRERALEIDADAWKLLHETLRTVENEEGVHLGRALAGPVAARFEELTAGRYRALRLDASLQAEGLQTADANDDDNVLAALSVGTRDQLAALVRLTIADQLRTAVVLDDHLVHSDLARLHWFRDVLQKTAINAQVIVLTCRAEDYVGTDELPVDSVTRDVAAGTIRTIDAARVVTRYGA
jgi:DNA repair exonuclease SbcCD ATPase subunit